MSNSSAQGYGAAWRKLRPAILERDPTCVICRRAPSTHVDHRIPRKRGGTDAPSNLRGLCASCHGAKTAARDGGFSNPIRHDDDEDSYDAEAARVRQQRRLSRRQRPETGFDAARLRRMGLSRSQLADIDRQGGVFVPMMVRGGRVKRHYDSIRFVVCCLVPRNGGKVRRLPLWRGKDGRIRKTTWEVGHMVYHRDGWSSLDEREQASLCQSTSDVAVELNSLMNPYLPAALNHTVMRSAGIGESAPMLKGQWVRQSTESEPSYMEMLAKWWRRTRGWTPKQTQNERDIKRACKSVCEREKLPVSVY